MDPQGFFQSDQDSLLSPGSLLFVLNGEIMMDTGNGSNLQTTKNKHMFVFRVAFALVFFALRESFCGSHGYLILKLYSLFQ